MKYDKEFLLLFIILLLVNAAFLSSGDIRFDTDKVNREVDTRAKEIAVMIDFLTNKDIEVSKESVIVPETLNKPVLYEKKKFIVSPKKKSDNLKDNSSDISSTEKIKEKPDIKVAGIIEGKDSDKVAVIELLAAKKSYIVKKGFKFTGYLVKDITENTVLLEKDGKDLLLEYKQE